MNEIKTYDFFRGGNATFTVSNPTGEHYTFKIRRPKAEKPEDQPPFFVSLLAGPDNEGDYVYIGIFNPDTADVRLTRKSRMKDESIPVKVVRWALRRFQAGDSLPSGYAIQHEGKCCRCGRTLTTPESIERGIGPECIKFFS